MRSANASAATSVSPRPTPAATWAAPRIPLPARSTAAGWHPERVEPVAAPDRDALVIGAGPAGMECAITLAKRGLRRVRLVDAAHLTGGHLRWVTRLPGLGEWGRVVAYRTVQARRLPNLEIELGIRMDCR